MTNGNDPAFPADTFAVHKDLPRDVILKLSQCQGMTIRTWLAGMAMAAVASCERHITRFGIPVEVTMKDSMDDHPPEAYAQVAVALADALLAELGKQK